MSAAEQTIITESGLVRYRLISLIQAEVCAYFRVAPIEMGSQRRARKVCRPRQIAMYLSREMTPHSLPMIGRHFGGRDHTTVMHAISVIEGLIESDGEMAHDIGELRLRLRRAA